MKTLSLCVVMILLGVSARGQQPSPPPATPPPLPPGPMIAPNPGDFAAWTVTEERSVPKRSSSGSSPAQDSKLVLAAERSVTKTADVTRIQTILGGRVAEDRWIVKGVQVVLADSAKYPVVDQPSPLLPAANFEEFSWISPHNFLGIRPYANRECLVFSEKRNIAPIGPPDLVFFTAVIDLDNRLPVVLQVGVITRTYAFGPPPTVMQVVPDSVKETLGEVEVNNSYLHRTPAKP